MNRYDHGGDIYSRHVELDFSVNVNPLGMPEAVKRALSADIENWQSYPDPHSRALRSKLAQQLGIKGEHILCGNGAADLIVRLSLGARPRHVLVCAPTFSEYEKAALMAGARVEEHILKEENGFALDESIFSALAAGPDMFFLCNPNNPTGALTPSALVERIADFCEGRGILFVIDECFLSFTGQPSARPLLEAHPHLIIIDAFTKLYAMAGLRLGYLMCSDRELSERISSFGQSWSVSSPAQTAGLAALSCEPEWTARTQDFVRAENEHLRSRLRSLGLTVYSGAANFTLFRAPAALGAKLLDRGILIRSCANYDGLDETYWRVGLKTRAENERLLKEIATILRVIS